MNNSDFWTDIERIIREGFTSEGLDKLDRYAADFISVLSVPQPKWTCRPFGNRSVAPDGRSPANVGVAVRLFPFDSVNVMGASSCGWS